jgi:hypothetical protein
LLTTSIRCLEIRFAVHHALATVLAVYIQPDTFRWCSSIRKIRWVRGKPWEEDSRLQIETDNAIGGTVDQLLMRFEANSRADFLSHF